MTIGEACKWRGQSGVRVDSDEFAVLDQRGDHRPVIAALVGACEQSVLAVESERPDGAFDDVVVEINATIVEEARQPNPAIEGVSDCFAELGLGADLAAACFEEPL
jgi:hypothetical protein